MKRYNSVYDGVYTKPNEMVEEANGDWVRWEDVEKLEAINAKLLEALQVILDDDMEDSKRAAYLGGFVLPDDLRQQAHAAIAKAKGEQP